MRVEKYIYVKKTEWSNRIRSLSHQKGDEQKFAEYLVLRLIREIELPERMIMQIRIKDIDFRKKLIKFSSVTICKEFYADIEKEIRPDLIGAIKQYVEVCKREQSDYLFRTKISLRSIFTDYRESKEFLYQEFQKNICLFE